MQKDTTSCCTFEVKLMCSFLLIAVYKLLTRPLAAAVISGCLKQQANVALCCKIVDFLGYFIFARLPVLKAWCIMRSSA